MEALQNTKPSSLISTEKYEKWEEEHGSA